MTDNSPNRNTGSRDLYRLVDVLTVGELKEKLSLIPVSPAEMHQLVGATLVGPIEGLGRLHSLPQIDKVGYRYDADAAAFSAEVTPGSQMAQIYVPGKNAPSRPAYKQDGRSVLTSAMQNLALVMRHLNNPHLGGTKNVAPADRSPVLTKQKKDLAALAIDVAMIELTEGWAPAYDSACADGIAAFNHYVGFTYDSRQSSDLGFLYMADKAKQLTLAAEELPRVS